jgi:microcompartment protein CcmK/EutM
MLMGRVIGTVWATRKDESLEGLRLLIVQELDFELKARGEVLVAVDSVQSGVGELVLVAKGSSARQTRLTQGKPVDAVIMASVDSFDVATLEALQRDEAQRNAAIARCLATANES